MSEDQQRGVDSPWTIVLKQLGLATPIAAALLWVAAVYVDQAIAEEAKLTSKVIEQIKNNQTKFEIVIEHIKEKQDVTNKKLDRLEELLLQRLPHTSASTSDNRPSNTDSRY